MNTGFLPILDWLQQTGLAVRIRDSLFLFPLLESVHVIGLALVFGTIAIVDLRLLGLASSDRPFQRVVSDTLKWTWGAFGLTALTGVLMFTTNATVYFHNTYFRVKVVLLVFAAINMLVFEFSARRTIHDWDRSPSAPRAGRIAAALSLAIWISVIFVGRMIGFTATRGTLAAPDPADVNLEELLGLPGDAGSAPAVPENK